MHGRCPDARLSRTPAPRARRAQPTLRPHRWKPAPPDFAEVFIRHGWRGVELAFGAGTPCNKRWVQACGGNDLCAARQTYRLELARLRREWC